MLDRTQCYFPNIVTNNYHPWLIRPPAGELTHGCGYSFKGSPYEPPRALIITTESLGLLFRPCVYSPCWALSWLFHRRYEPKGITPNHRFPFHIDRYIICQRHPTTRSDTLPMSLHPIQLILRDFCTPSCFFSSRKPMPHLPPTTTVIKVTTIRCSLVFSALQHCVESTSS